MKRLSFILFALALFLPMAADGSARIVNSLNLGWRFHAGDIAGAEGTRFVAGELPFEAERRTCVPAARIVCCIGEHDGRASVVGTSELSFGGSLQLKPFDRLTPQDGAFYIGFDRPLPADEACSLRITLCDDGGVPRNPVAAEDDFIPLVTMTAEYFDGIRWQTAELLEDSTHGMLFDGRFTVRTGGEMAKAAQVMVTEAVDAYVKQDLSLARKVMAHDDVVDDYFAQVKKGIIDIIAAEPSQGEYALDLLMIAKYFERIGDHCTNIAEWVEFSVTGVHKDCQ